jgi:DNA-binding MurR/RpiR family transcriptional regulator
MAARRPSSGRKHKPKLKMTVQDLIATRLPALSASEKRVARAVTDRYPVSALGQIEDIARASQVSAPTVTRFVRRLGFDRFVDFQRAIRIEVQDTEVSPLALLQKHREKARAAADDAPLVADLQASLSQILTPVTQDALDQAAQLISATSGRIYTLGGRWSSIAAQYLAFQLASLRGEVHALTPPPSGVLEDRIADFTKRDLLIIYDFRRYAPDLSAFARAARQQGARIVLLTDPDLSPITDLAAATVTCAVATTTPLETLAPAIAATDALLRRLVDVLGPAAGTRMALLERLRRAHP